MLRPFKVRQHLAFMEARGYSSRDVLASTQIEEARLTDPTYLVKPEQCHAVVGNIIRLTGDPGIGLVIGSETTIPDLGIVGHAMAASGRLGEALALWQRYVRSPVGSPFTLELSLTTQNGCWGASAAAINIDAAVYRFYVEETFAMGLAMGRVLTGRKLEVKTLSLAYSAPEYSRRYQEVFECDVEFGATTTRAFVKSPSLDTRVRGGDADIRDLCVRHCSLLVQQLERHGLVSSRLRMFLNRERRVVDLNAAAEALNMSPRSFRRHLRAEGITFQQILDEYRKDVANEHIASGILSTKQIANLLGFANADSFRRAYKEWTREAHSSTALLH